jgi:hypothetical protein
VQKKEASEKVQVLDVAQILARSVALKNRSTPPPAAAPAAATSEPSA